MYFQAIFLVNSNPFKQFRNYVESFYHTDNKPQILRLIIRVILLDKSYIIFTWQILIFENKYKRKARVILAVFMATSVVFTFSGCGNVTQKIAF